MRYTATRYKREKREEAYRFYVTDSLSYGPQNKYITQRYADLIKPKATDNRSGDEIAADVIRTLGLKFE